MTEQTEQNNWLQEEAKELNTQTEFDGEKLPALKFEEGKIISFNVDFSEPFKKWSRDHYSYRYVMPDAPGRSYQKKPSTAQGNAYC